MVGGASSGGATTESSTDDVDVSVLSWSVNKKQSGAAVANSGRRDTLGLELQTSRFIVSRQDRTDKYGANARKCFSMEVEDERCRSVDETDSKVTCGDREPHPCLGTTTPQSTQSGSRTSNAPNVSVIVTDVSDNGSSQTSSNITISQDMSNDSIDNHNNHADIFIQTTNAEDGSNTSATFTTTFGNRPRIPKSAPKAPHTRRIGAGTARRLSKAVPSTGDTNLSAELSIRARLTRNNLKHELNRRFSTRNKFFKQHNSLDFELMTNSEKEFGNLPKPGEGCKLKESSPSFRPLLLIGAGSGSPFSTNTYEDLPTGGGSSSNCSDSEKLPRSGSRVKSSSA